MQAALELAFTDELLADEVRSKIESLAGRVHAADIDITTDDVWEVSDGRLADEDESTTYSWGHLISFACSNSTSGVSRGRPKMNFERWLRNCRRQHHARSGK